MRIIDGRGHGGSGSMTPKKHDDLEEKIKENLNLIDARKRDKEKIGNIYLINLQDIDSSQIVLEDNNSFRENPKSKVIDEDISTLLIYIGNGLAREYYSGKHVIFFDDDEVNINFLPKAFYRGSFDIDELNELKNYMKIVPMVVYEGDFIKIESLNNLSEKEKEKLCFNHGIEEEIANIVNERYEVLRQEIVNNINEVKNEYFSKQFNEAYIENMFYNIKNSKRHSLIMQNVNNKKEN